MESKEKELYLKMLRVEEDLNSMNDELLNLIEKYPQNMDLQTLKNENKNFYESNILKKIRKTYLDNLRNNFSTLEFESILKKYNMELEKIKKWLNDVAKEYLKNKNILYLYTSIILLIISVVEILSTKDKIFTSPPFFSTTFVSGKSSFL